MVAHPRATAGLNRLRPLNQPKPVKVQEDVNGNPIAITHKGRRIAIEGIKDRWRIDDEWWRKAIARMYYQVVLQDGRILTLFHDLLGGAWFAQSASMPEPRQGNLRVFVARSAKTGCGVSTKNTLTRDDFNVCRIALP